MDLIDGFSDVRLQPGEEDDVLPELLPVEEALQGLDVDVVLEGVVEGRVGLGGVDAAGSLFESVLLPFREQERGWLGGWFCYQILIGVVIL